MENDYWLILVTFWPPTATSSEEYQVIRNNYLKFLDAPEALLWPNDQPARYQKSYLEFNEIIIDIHDKPALVYFNFAEPMSFAVVRHSLLHLSPTTE